MLRSKFLIIVVLLLLPTISAYSLGVQKQGEGTVKSDAFGIDCGWYCSKDYAPGSRITLTATTGHRSSFSHWEGACSGTEPTCVVDMNSDKIVIAIFESAKLTIEKEGVGEVKSNAFGIDCGWYCSKDFPVGVEIILTATPGHRSSFVRWEGACSGTEPTCTVIMDGSKTVKAVFSSSMLTIEKEGEGTVKSDAFGIDCGWYCSKDFPVGAEITLTATPSHRSSFLRWEGACSGTEPTCTVIMDGSKTVKAIFDGRYLLVQKQGNGDGIVKSNAFGIDCGWYCSKDFPVGVEIILTATPNARSSFIRWEGACSGSEPTCVVTLENSKNVTAVFESRRLGVNKVGTGQIKSAPFGIDCGWHCVRDYPVGTEVTLVATPNHRSSFSHWEGDCSGSEPTCVITMDENKNVEAVFASSGLSIYKQGNGDGIVKSNAFGISCGWYCSKDFPVGAEITLTATPNARSSFIRWEGACLGSEPTCVVTLENSKNVTAVFESRRLGVEKEGLGEIKSAPFGIDCGWHCVRDYPVGTLVTLRATPNIRYLFDRWGGACLGSEPTCVVDMSENKNVKAVFISRTEPYGIPLETPNKINDDQKNKLQDILKQVFDVDIEIE